MPAEPGVLCRLQSIPNRRGCASLICLGAVPARWHGSSNLGRFREHALHAEVWLKPFFAQGYQLAVRAATTEFTGQLFEEANSVRVIVTRVATELPSRQRLRKSAHVRSETRCAPQGLPRIVNTLLGLKL
ncbi:unnamed protein product [Symbiodinium sp. KB8]|nr:unnamed protein product [Symbiodinium sp. KB8]